MERRIISLLMCLMLVLSAVPCLAATEEVGLNPPEEWWGMSKTAFINAYKDEKFD